LRGKVLYLSLVPLTIYRGTGSPEPHYIFSLFHPLTAEQYIEDFSKKKSSTVTMSDPVKNPEKTGRDRLYRDSTSDSQTMVEHADHASSSNPRHGEHDEAAKRQLDASKRLANPFAGLNPQKLAGLGEAYARKAGLTSEEDLRAFRLGAMIAGDDNKYDTISELTTREREVLDRETTHKWSNPGMLYWVVVGQ
jgi:hypothetical protein